MGFMLHYIGKSSFVSSYDCLESRYTPLIPAVLPDEGRADDRIAQERVFLRLAVGVPVNLRPAVPPQLGEIQVCREDPGCLTVK